MVITDGDTVDLIGNEEVEHDENEVTGASGSSSDRRDPDMGTEQTLEDSTSEVKIPRNDSYEDEFTDDVLVEIPDTEEEGKFSFRKLWAFTGPGFLMSIAYLDPGNIESDLQSGAKAQYKLLWILLTAHIMGMLLQRMSARLGVVSGKHMAEVAHSFYPFVPRIALWVMIEIAIIGSDMQEVIGTAIAFYLLSNGLIPLYVGVLITILDTITFLFIDRYGFRKLELVFAVLISVMAVSFGYEFFTVQPEPVEIIKGMFIPWCEGCGREEFLQSRKVDRSKEIRVREANLYYFVESALALCCSFFINMFVVTVFAHGLFNKTNADVRAACMARHGIPNNDTFPNNTLPVESDIYKGGMFLGCEFGLPALYIWALGIFAAGQSSTMTGTYSGQFVMEGFIRVRWPKWKRVFVTRAIAIAPTLAVALWAHNIDKLTGMNDLLNCVQMIQLPFALIPIITFTSSKKIMHNFKSSKSFQTFALLASALVIAINIYFISDYITSTLGTEWYILLALIIPAVIYFGFICYLTVYCFMACGMLSEHLTIRGFHFDRPYEVEAPWLKKESISSQITTTTNVGPHSFSSNTAS